MKWEAKQRVVIRIPSGKRDWYYSRIYGKCKRTDWYVSSIMADIDGVYEVELSRDAVFKL